MLAHTFRGSTWKSALGLESERASSSATARSARRSGSTSERRSAHPLSRGRLGHAISLPAAVDAPTSLPASTPDEMTRLARSSNAFAFDLYRGLGPGAGNRAISPASVSTALAMAWAGARGGTAEQMQRVLRFEGSPDAMMRASGRAGGRPPRPDAPRGLPDREPAVRREDRRVRARVSGRHPGGLRSGPGAGGLQARDREGASPDQRLGGGEDREADPRPGAARGAWTGTRASCS